MTEKVVRLFSREFKLAALARGYFGDTALNLQSWLGLNPQLARLSKVTPRYAARGRENTALCSANSASASSGKARKRRPSAEKSTWPGHSRPR